VASAEDGLPGGALLAAAALYVRGSMSAGALHVVCALDQSAPSSGATFRLGDRLLADLARVRRDRVPGLVAEAQRALGRSRMSAGRSGRFRSTYWVARGRLAPAGGPDQFGGRHLAPAGGPDGGHLAPARGPVWPPPGGHVPTSIGESQGAGPNAGPPTGLRPEPPAAAPGAPVPAVGGRHGSGASPRGPRQGAGAGGAPAPPIGTVSAADVAAAQGRALLRARRNGS
jgi:hypothetical protein